MFFTKRVANPKYNVGQLVACKVADAGLKKVDFPTALGVIRRIQPVTDSGKVKDYLYHLEWLSSQFQLCDCLREDLMQEIVKFGESLRKDK